MGYKYELHLCTEDLIFADKQGVSAKKIVSAYEKAGYAGIVLTSPLGDWDLRDKKGPIARSEQPKKALDAYRKLCRAAEGRLTVLLGSEMHFRYVYGSLLVYGMNESFLEDMTDVTPFAQYMYMEDILPWLRKNGMIVFQAHPMTGYNMLFPDVLLKADTASKKRLVYVDGQEVYTGNGAALWENDFSYRWSEHFGCHMISGSAYAAPGSRIAGGIVTDEPVEDNETLLRILLGRNYRLIRDGKEDEAHV